MTTSNGYTEAVERIRALDAPTLDEVKTAFGAEHLAALNEGHITLATALDGAVTLLQHYVHFREPEQAWAAALWAAATHAAPQCDILPRLAVLAPTRGSGKTRLLEVLAGMVANPWGPLVGPSAAALYRKVETDHPTVLLDEVDRLFERRQEDNAAIVEVINAGHVRGATVPRVVGQGTKQKVHDFDVYTPMALAGIATTWPDTVLDRAVVVVLEKRKDDEPVAPWRQRMRWQTEAVAAYLAELVPAVESMRHRHMPAELSDRQQDNWEALFAIANAAGGHWPEAVKRAAISLCRKQTAMMAADEREEVQLLNDVHGIFEERDPVSGFIGSGELVEYLVALDDRPWQDYPGTFTTHKLAKLFRRLSIHPVNPFGSSKRGYDRKHVAEVWQRIGSRTDDWGRPSTT